MLPTWKVYVQPKEYEGEEIHVKCNSSIAAVRLAMLHWRYKYGHYEKIGPGQYIKIENQTDIIEYADVIGVT